MDPKFGEQASRRARDPRNPPSKLRFAIVAITALALYNVWPLLPEARGKKENPSLSSNSPFRWPSIKPSKELQYHDCYEGFQCARLDLPMDYRNPDDPEGRVAIAIVRKPARVPTTDPRYGGPVLVNPGGPGGSGVAKVLLHGEPIQQIVDSHRSLNESTDSDKYFDIIGFDPRGVNSSTPILACFPDNFARQSWNLQTRAEGILGSSEGSLRVGWRRANALAYGCSRRLETDNGTNFLEHVNTTPVVADMVEIIERHGEWRERQGVKAQQLSHLKHVGDVEDTIMQRTKWRKGKEPLLYWGFSYGTIIGSTFASMYPDRVSRVLLDGVVDAEDYHNGPWLGNLQDTDRILEELVRYCFEAGQDHCRFWRSGGPQAILAAYEKLLHDIRDDPLSVPGNSQRGPEIITWSDIKMVVVNALYQPVMLGPIMAELLQDITNGTGRVFADYKQTARKPSCQSAQCEANGPFSEECISQDWNDLEATAAVICTDAQDIGSFTEDEFRMYWRTLQDQSRTMGDLWAQTRLNCAGWRTRAKWRFSGPFTANTSHPILWLGNTLDPVTPLRNAKRMNERFPGSVLLQQDSAGHCSFTAPSLCTAKAVREYFQTGVMPKEGTVCKPDVKPFELGRASVSSMGMSREDADLLDALTRMASIVDSHWSW